MIIKWIAKLARQDWKGQRGAMIAELRARVLELETSLDNQRALAASQAHRIALMQRERRETEVELARLRALVLP